MPWYFFDRSALVKRYVAEVGSSWVNGIVDPGSGHTGVVARITGVELVSALARRQRAVHRRPRMPRLRLPASGRNSTACLT